MPKANVVNQAAYDFWYRTNVFEQRQKGYFAVKVKVPLGDIQAEKARLFAQLVKRFAADDIRVSVNQGFVLRYITADNLPHLYNGLYAFQ